MVNNKLYY